jgi:AcrR family transcriptional regulator
MALKMKVMAPRKRPQQARARATVEAVLEASTYILVKDGWERFTTNRVAERAGVNIASLYQYFPNKEAIVVELFRQHVAKASPSDDARRRAWRPPKTFRGLLRAIVEAGVNEHRAAPALHRVFEEELPRSARRAVNVHEAEQAREWANLLRPFVRNVPDPDVALFISRVVGHAALHETAIERPELLQNPALVEELVTLLDRYLRR